MAKTGSKFIQCRWESEGKRLKIAENWLRRFRMEGGAKKTPKLWRFSEPEGSRRLPAKGKPKSLKMGNFWKCDEERVQRDRRSLKSLLTSCSNFPVRALFQDLWAEGSSQVSPLSLHDGFGGSGEHLAPFACPSKYSTKRQACRFGRSWRFWSWRLPPLKPTPTYRAPTCVRVRARAGAVSQPRVRQKLRQALQDWQHRQMLSPAAVASWDCIWGRQGRGNGRRLGWIGVKTCFYPGTGLRPEPPFTGVCGASVHEIAKQSQKGPFCRSADKSPKIPEKASKLCRTKRVRNSVF